MPKALERFVFEPTYSKEAQGLDVLSVADIPRPADFAVQGDPVLVHIAPGGFGGNHRHQRRELWVAYGDGLYLIWRDENGQKQETRMSRTDGKLQALMVAPWVPHAVENRGSSPGLLYELRDMQDGSQESLTGEDSLRVTSR